MINKSFPNFILLLSTVMVSFLFAETTEYDTQISKANETGFHILKSLSKDSMRNIAVSPLSINAVFGIVQKGTAGKTLANLKESLGDTSLYQNFCKQYNTEHNELSLASLIVVDRSLKLNEKFKEEIPANELRQVDFKANPQEECNKINLWVEENTKGEIKDLLKQDSINNQTVMIALNAIAFESIWQEPFDEKNTMPGDFITEDGHKVKTDMMRRTGDTNFSITENGTTIVSLPYASEQKNMQSDLSFVIIMPGKDIKLADYIADLNYKAIEKIPSDKRDPVNATFIMPKFEIRTDTVSLVAPLKKLGLNQIFDPENADFSNMTAERGIYVEDVLHKCYIKVDEKGTKAAAATAVTIQRMSLPPTIEINRPFFWMIYDRSKNLILFCGTFDTPGV